MTALLLFLPEVLLIAGLVLLTMGRPVFFAHPRVGFQRKVFNCYKFRSMVRDPDTMLARHLAGNPEATGTTGDAVTRTSTWPSAAAGSGCSAYVGGSP